MNKYKASTLLVESVCKKMINYNSNYLFIYPQGAVHGEEIAQTFSMKLDEFHPETIGDKTYLELLFPPISESKEVFNLFFDSIKIGLTKNKYCGTFFISLSKYSGFDELRECLYFDRFEKLIEENIENIVFFIHVEKGFGGQEELYEWMSSKKNTIVIEDYLPSVKEIISYIDNELIANDVSLDQKEKELVTNIIINASKMKKFKGFKSVEIIINKIIFIKCIEEQKLKKDFIEIEMFEDSKRKENKIGF